MWAKRSRCIQGWEGFDLIVGWLIVVEHCNQRSAGGQSECCEKGAFTHMFKLLLLDVEL